MRCEYQEANPQGGFHPPICQEPGDRRALDAAGPAHLPRWTGYYCGPHALKVVERANPKAIVDCSSCGCKIGVPSGGGR
jgi:hypothetical protein